MNISEFLGYTIPVISVFASYICGRMQSSHQNKTDAMKERYEKFYIPYIRTLYQGHIYSGVQFTDLSTDVLLQLFGTIMDNIQYLDELSLMRVHHLYDCMLDMLEWRDGNPEFSAAPAKCEAEFRLFTKHVLIESEGLSKALHLPSIGTHLLLLISMDRRE